MQTNDETLTQESGAHKSAKIGVLRKRIRSLAAIYGEWKTSFELEEEPVFDHCPNSTFSDWKKNGLEIDSEMVMVLGYGGVPTRIARYRVAEPSREAARKILLAAGVEV